MMKKIAERIYAELPAALQRFNNLLARLHQAVSKL